MQNRKILIAAFITSALLFTSCKKAVNQENLNATNVDTSITNPENLPENLVININESLMISEAPQGMTASAKLTSVDGGQAQEITIIGSKLDTAVEVSFKLPSTNTKVAETTGPLKTYVLCEYKDGKWSEIGDYYSSNAKEIKARMKVKKGIEQKIILAVKEKTDVITLRNDNQYTTYNSSGLFLTEAMRNQLNIDAMLLPSGNIKFGISPADFTWNSTTDYTVFDYYKNNKVTVGTISGKGLKEFLIKRSSVKGEIDIQGGRLEYNISCDKTGKEVSGKSTFYLNGKPLKDSKQYTIGLDSYQFKNYGLESFGFVKTVESSATQGELINSFVKNTNYMINFQQFTAKVEKTPGNTLALRKIYDIQGEGFVSPYNGDKVTDIEGIITAVDVNGTDASGGIDGFYIQDPLGDGNDKTSDGIYVRYSMKKDVYDKDTKIAVGNRIKFNATVEEYFSESEGLSQTQLINVDSKSITKIGTSPEPLPAPVVLGKDRKIPTTAISTYRGDLNQKTVLNLSEGIDFYESIEGMRIAIENPLVTDVYDTKQIYVVAPNNYTDSLYNNMGGLVIKENDMNPEIMVINQETIIGTSDKKTFGHPKGVSKGAKFNGIVEGVMNYNTGSNGGYTFINTKPLPSFTSSTSTKETAAFTGDSENLTIGSYNVENLFATASHMKAIAASIVTNLKSPDILGLIEIQDDDGENNGATTGSQANKTLDTLVEKIKAAGGPEYKWINIDPQENMDGGAPGGNIRVAYIYNPNRVTFKPYGNATYNTVGTVNMFGNLNANPVRINPLNTAFKNSRKSLAAQFEFNGQKITVIANHLNSKRGDSSQWGALQPVELGSVPQRVEMAKEINSFAKSIVSKNGNVVLLGDFNEFYFENAMQEFKGNVKNMMEKLPLNERYTYVYKGNSQTLDHMLVSPKMYDKAQIDIVHINAGFLDQISDHDPVVSKFNIPKK